ncbi:2-C-methyl-D-erythritol 2,4-cyclodiphosphate synthase [Chromohalobacter sp. 11-W]|uniref:2-C-methyl-D-erythritol 2,4-cyclodiphosphate synthase n=1 Tax=Chromohalobacter sp. 11-W TaxID=2994061 RepID=UPI002468DD04|nr:2-C-methyl-D-erythritol 2,4-cyclodiphosphate synthase [Chromohalobacter sp. 11-W]
MTLRIGHGFDVHRFGDGDHLMIGGVRIAHTHAFIAHSDGDVLLHALCDALLGACGLGDIGQHFPDTDAAWAGVDSRELLRRVYDQVTATGYRIVNLDTTVIAQAPRLADHIALMRTRIAETLGIAEDGVNVKATTSERLGFTGRKEGIAAEAVVLLTRADAT